MFREIKNKAVAGGENIELDFFVKGLLFCLYFRYSQNNAKTTITG